MGLDPFLQAFHDKVPFLQVFAQRVHTGSLAAGKNPIKSRSVEDYARNVAQTFLHVAANDPRLNSANNIDFRLQRTLKAWKSTDPAPLRVKPIPISVVRRIAALSRTTESHNPLFCATADMIIVAFFFLLRPGEYTDNDKDPFRLLDVQLFIGDTRLQVLSAPVEQIQQAQFASLTFTTQKNGVRGEVISLACSGDPVLCPVQALIRRVLYLRQHSAPVGTPIARVFGSTSTVTSPLSLRLYATLSFPSARPLASFPAMFRHDASGPREPQPFYLHKSTRTSSASLDAGGPTKCCDTCMSKRTPS